MFYILLYIFYYLFCLSLFLGLVILVWDFLKFLKEFKTIINEEYR